jgi:hypothetical protein
MFKLLKLSIFVCIFLIEIELLLAQNEVFRSRIPYGSAGHSSVAVADVVKASAGVEIVSATSSGSVSVFSREGQLLWSVKLPNFLCLGTNENNKLYASPAVGDLDGDGQREIVIGYGGIDLGACAGGVAALRGEDGKKLWYFDVRRNSRRERYSAVYGTPTLGDVDNDGRLEVAFGSHDRNVYLLSSTGRVIHIFHAGDTVFSSPVFVDIDSNPGLELVIGTDITRNKKAKTRDGGVVYALRLTDFNRKSSKLKKRPTRLRRASDKVFLRKEFNLFNPKSYIWKRPLAQVIQSSPAIANLISGNAGQEIVVGSGCYFPERSPNKKGKWLKVLSLSTGRVLRTLKTRFCVRSSPSVADLNGDGLLDVIALVSSNNGVPEVIAWTPEVSNILWRHRESDPNLGENGKQAVVADLNGDSRLEIVYGSGSSLIILDGATGIQKSCSVRCLWSPLRLRSTVSNTPTIYDLNGDGKPEIIGSAREVVAWQAFDRELSVRVASPFLTPFEVPWGTWLFNPERNSLFRPSDKFRHNKRNLIKSNNPKFKKSSTH